MTKKHLSHAEVLARLRRAEGHLKSIITMIEEDRSCIDVAQQLHAVERAIATAKQEHIHDHIEHCLEDGMDSKAGIQELKILTKYL